MLSDRLPRRVLEQQPRLYDVLRDFRVERGRDSTVIGAMLGCMDVTLDYARGHFGRHLDKIDSRRMPAVLRCLCVTWQ